MNQMKKSHRTVHIIALLCAVVIIIAVAVTILFAYRTHLAGNADNTSTHETAKGTSIGDIQSEVVTLDGDSIIIKYPTIETNNNGEKSDIVNSLLREAALQKLYDQYLADENGEFTYDITDTTLYRSSGTISSVSKGRLHAENSAHNYIFAYSVNIDEDTGKLYTFSDIIADFDSFKKIFLAGKFTLTDGSREVVDDLGWEYLMSQCSVEYDIYPDIYMDGDLIGVIFEVPYTVGSTAIFTINKSELDSALAMRFR